MNKALKVLKGIGTVLVVLLALALLLALIVLMYMSIGWSALLSLNGLGVISIDTNFSTVAYAGLLVWVIVTIKNFKFKLPSKDKEEDIYSTFEKILKTRDK